MTHNAAEKTRMTQPRINDLYTILHRFNKAAAAAGLRYWISAGTALGAVRHGGLIPWDDDGDVYVLEPDFRPRAYQLYMELNRRGLYMAPHKLDGADSSAWFKVYLGGQVFPNVDIFLLSWTPEEECWKLSDDTARSWWPKECLKTDELQASRDIMFGPLKLPIFGYPERYLTRTYGADWNTVVWEGWDHEKEQPHASLDRPLTDRRPALPTIQFY
jgi:lipopolysaccharide cholinephosphotransferase